MKKQWGFRKMRYFVWALLFSAALFLCACGDDDNDNNSSNINPNTQVTTSDRAFSEAAVPVTDFEKRAVLAASSVTIDGSSYDIGYNTLMRSGQTIGEETFGLIRDHKGAPVLLEDGSEFVSASADFSSLLQLGDKLYNVTHFESQPGAM